MSPAVKKTKKAPARRSVSQPAPSLKMYRRIAVGFVVSVALMLGSVLYVSTVSATIRVTPVKETVTASFLADVVKTPTKETEVRGRVVAASVGRTESFAPSGEGMKDVEGKAAGTVTVTNASGRVQPLVATTRLLSPDGVLFRIDETVSVPAGGSVEVGAHADLAGASGDIPAGIRMTIPGLSESLQAMIYAESKTEISGGITSVSVISQQDIDRSALTLRGTLEEDAKAALRAQIGEAFAGEAFSFEVVDQTSSVPAGTEANEFSVTMTVKSVGVFYDRVALEGIASRKLYEQLAPGETFTALNTAGLQVAVDKVDAEAGAANVRVYLDGEAVASSTSQSLDPGRFVGMSQAEVKQALVRDGIATDVFIEFRPFWVTRVPQLKDHVYVEIE